MATKKLKRHDYDARETRGGRYVASPKCDCCGKPVGTAYFTDADVCGDTDGPGFYLCERVRCMARRDGLGVEERRALYTATRAAVAEG